MSRVRQALVAFGALLVFGAANGTILQKQAVLDAGRPVLLRLAPVDPRSLMQGDYMRLRYDRAVYPETDAAAGVPWRGTVVLTLDADGVGKDLLLAPFLKRFFHTEGVSELEGSGEILLHAVVTVHGLEFGAPDDAEGLEELRTHHVLSAVAPGHGEKGRPQAPPPAEHHEQTVVFVVRMGRSLHITRSGPELTDRQRQSGGSLIQGERLELCP